MSQDKELVNSLSQMFNALNHKLESIALEQQISKIHIATLTGLIGDAMPDRVERMIEILSVAEQEADDALHTEAFRILRESLEHAFAARDKSPPTPDSKTTPAWLVGVIDGSKKDKAEEP